MTLAVQSVLVTRQPHVFWHSPGTIQSEAFQNRLGSRNVCFLEWVWSTIQDVIQESGLEKASPRLIPRYLHEGYTLRSSWGFEEKQALAGRRQCVLWAGWASVWPHHNSAVIMHYLSCLMLSCFITKWRDCVKEALWGFMLLLLFQNSFPDKTVEGIQLYETGAGRTGPV